MADHMVFLSCWLITYKLLYQFYCCWLLLTGVRFLLSIVPLFHIFSASPEKMHLVFTMFDGLNCERYLLQLCSVKKRCLPNKKLTEQELQPYTMYCFKTGSWKYWKQSYSHQNLLWLCKNNVALGIYSDKH